MVSTETQETNKEVNIIGKQQSKLVRTKFIPKKEMPYWLHKVRPTRASNNSPVPQLYDRQVDFGLVKLVSTYNFMFSLNI